MATLALANPPRRRRRSRARRAMSALQRKYFGGGGRKRRSSGRRRSRRRSTTTVVYKPARRSRRRSGGFIAIGPGNVMGATKHILVSGGAAAAGGLGVDYALNWIPWAKDQQGWARIGIKAGLAVATYLLAAKFAPRMVKPVVAPFAIGMAATAGRDAYQASGLTFLGGFRGLGAAPSPLMLGSPGGVGYSGANVRRLPRNQYV